MVTIKTGTPVVLQANHYLTPSQLNRNNMVDLFKQEALSFIVMNLVVIAIQCKLSAYNNLTTANSAIRLHYELRKRPEP
jgi:hypothetical protein